MVTHVTQESVMDFIGKLEKRAQVRAKQGKEVRKVLKRALDGSSTVLRRKRRPPGTKEELAYWLSKSDGKASEKQFFVRPNRPFRTLPPRLVPAGALLYIVPAFLGDYIVIKLIFFIGPRCTWGPIYESRSLSLTE